MFKIIGGDGQQYGPVAAEELLKWIAAGRANAQTMAQREGESEWKPLSTFAQFAEALTQHPPAPSLPPVVPDATTPPPNPDILAGEILARGFEVNLGHCLGRAWDLLQKDFWPIVGVNALMIILLSLANGAYVGLLLNGPLFGGAFFYCLKKVRRQSATMSDAFAGFTLAFVQLFLASLVSGLLIGVGLMFCILPGIYLLVAWKFAMPLVIERRLGFWEAMEVSRKVVSRNWWSMFGFGVVCGLINFGGALLCGIGLFVTWPLTLLAAAFLYEDIFGTTSNPSGA